MTIQVKEEHVSCQDKYGSPQSIFGYTLNFSEQYEAQQVGNVLTNLSGRESTQHLIDMATLPYGAFSGPLREIANDWNRINSLLGLLRKALVQVPSGDGVVTLVDVKDYLAGNVDLDAISKLERAPTMRVEKKITIEETDVSTLHSELSDVLDFFTESSSGGESWVKDEFPTLTRLRRMLGQMVIAEPSDQIYDKLKVLEGKGETKETSRLKGRFRVVRADETSPS